MEARVDASPQFTVDKVAQTPRPEAKGDQRGDKIGDLEESAFGASGKNDHHEDDANQAAVERHAAVPDAEQIQRVLQENRQIIEQDIADTATEENAKEPGIQQVFDFVFGPAAARTVGPTGG